MYIKPIELVRKQLNDTLSEIWERALLIISAPSGYGKTTAVKLFFSRHPEMIAFWIRLEHAEMDEVWVWRKLCEVFREHNSRLSQILTELGLPGTEQEIDYFISIIRENIREPVCIVFDDYHDCNSPAINRLIERVVYEEITNLHLIIISRIYPDISCEDMILKGYCTAIDQQMLALTREESDEIFRINGFELSPMELEKMYEYTDGWIAAVYLALYDYRRTGRFEHLSNIGRLLKKAIFDKLPEQIQELCMKMSLFENFTLKEACYVLNKEIPFMALVQMQEQFGFIQFDTTSGTFVMHSLLRNVAAGELDRMGTDKKYLYIRCGEYKEKAEKYNSAILCFRKAGEYEKILKILSGEKRNIIFEQMPGLLDEIFDEIPLDMKLKYASAYLGYIYYIILKYNSVKGKELLAEAADRYQVLYENHEKYPKLRGELLVIESLLDFNDLAKINIKLKEAYELLGRQPSGIFEDSLLTFGAPSMSSLYYRKSGELKETIELEKVFAEYHMRLVRGIPGGWNDFFDAEYALMINEVEKANELSKKVTEKAKFIKVICIVISSYYVRLRCLIYLGREKEFYEVMQEFEEQMKDTVRPVLLTDYELACGYIYACLGRIDMIPAWLNQFHLENCSRVVRNIRSGCVVYGMILCHLNNWVLADAVADQILVPYELTNHAYIIIFGYILKAIAALHLEGLEKAGEYLSIAARLAELDQLKIPFIEAGSYIMPVVESLSREDKFCASLIKPIKEYQRGLKAFDRKEIDALLTRREEELMHLVKSGLRNSEISQKMHIALVTVEKNLTNIYRKLNVTNRAAAIAKVEELHLI